MRRAHQVLLWLSSSLALFAIVALVWAVVTGFVLGMVLDPIFLLINCGNAAWQRRSLTKLPPRISRHDAALAEIDRLEHALRMGKYEKTQAEFDAEVEAAVRPFRWWLTSQTRRLADRRRSASGANTGVGGIRDIAEAYTQFTRALLYGDNRVKTAPNGHPCWAPGTGLCYSDCGLKPWGKCFYRPDRRQLP